MHALQSTATYTNHKKNSRLMSLNMHASKHVIQTYYKFNHDIRINVKKGNIMMHTIDEDRRIRERDDEESQK